MVWIAMCFGLGGMAIGQSHDRPSIPNTSIHGSDFTIAYRMVQETIRNQADNQSIIKDKEEQYRHLVSEGKVSQSAADELLRALRSFPLKSTSVNYIHFIKRNDRLLVTMHDAKKVMTAWSLIQGDYTVSKGWSGGDHISLSRQVEPYSRGVGNVPILPIQLPNIKTFVDLDEDERSSDAATSRFDVKMLNVSTSTDSYLKAKLSFEHGHLAMADIPQIERWQYSGYSKSDPPLPSFIVLERNFSSSGSPQEVTKYSQVAPFVQMQGLKQLITGATITAFDERSDPFGQFNFEKSKGSILDQAQSAIPMPRMRRADSFGAPNLSIGTILVFSGIGLLFVVVLVKFAGLRKGRQANR